MDTQTWSRDAIGAFVAGGQLCLRDEAAQELPVPYWMAAASAGVSSISAAERLAGTEREDRTAITVGFMEALGKPGDVVEVHYRARTRNGLALERLRFLNLLDDDGVGAVLLVTDRPDLGDALPDLPDPPDPGERDATHWLIQYLDRNAVITRVEGRTAEILGRSPDELIGHTPLDFVHPDSYADSFALWFDLLEHPGSTRTTRRRYVRADNSEVWCEASYLNRLGDDGTGDVVVLVYDISERRAQEDELRATREESHHLASEFRLLAEEVPAAVFRSEPNGLITFCNNRWTELLGAEHDVTNLIELARPQDRERLQSELDRLANDASVDSVTLELDGLTSGTVLSLTCRAVGDLESERRSFVGSISDVTDTVELRKRASTDALTGLLNRTAFEDLLSVALADDREHVVVAFLDLDGFKAVNDTFGHSAGDAMLQGVAERLRDALRADDLIGRYGGDEFVVGCTAAGAGFEAALRQRLAQVFQRPIHFGQLRWDPAVSIGVVRPEPQESLASILGRADAAMFTAKHDRHLRLA